MAKLGEVILRDTLANRPAAEVEGRLFYDTTNDILYRDSGVAWESVEGGAGSSSLTVKEVDGTPTVSGVETIVVSNGTLTNDGGGQVTLETGGGGAPAFSGALVSFEDPQNIAQSSVTVTWDEEIFDTDGYFSIANPTRLTVPADGYYRIRFNVRLQDGGEEAGYMVATINATREAETPFAVIADLEAVVEGGSGPHLQSSGIAYLETGDYLEVAVTHYNSAGNTLLGFYNCSFEIERLGA